jgi:uncharacterized protein YecT (DUF1311 family)
VARRQIHAINAIVPAKLALSCLALILTAPAFSQTQAQITAQACAGYKKADLELNQVYQQILAANSADAAFTRALATAQRAWLAFRDAHIVALYPNPKPGAYGSVFPVCRCGMLEQITAQRTRELRELWVEGTVEGDVCAGSSPVRRANAPPEPGK